ncbi:MAG: hypothetical protein EOO38_06885 [Cytophagaceae bacterium]|nr:MAG: hypothetical protein EOO38_06885 [Cytophagaceae bacterium]
MLFQLVSFDKGQDTDEARRVICSRVMTDSGILLSGTDHCDEAWSSSRAVEADDELGRYQDLAKKFLDFLDSMSIPDGREAFFGELRISVGQFANAHLSSAATPQQEPSLYQMTPENLANAEAQLQRVSAQSTLVSPSLFETLSDGRNTNEQQYSTADIPENLAVQSHALGWWGRHIMHDADKIDIVEKTVDPSREYRQQLEIWAQPFSFAGITSGSEHSAVYALVQWRPIDSEQPWQYLREWHTHNHGARAGEGLMRLKRTCLLDSMPVTKGYYIINGECDGSWLQDHVCNDDTAYQIRSAYGIWTDINDLGEGICRGRRRFNPPNCSVPW